MKEEITELNNNLDECKGKCDKVENYENEINELKENKISMFSELNKYEEQCNKYEKEINELKEIISREGNLNIENEKLKKELENINQNMIENKKLIDKYHEEAMNAKLQLANANYDSQEEIMKLKRIVKKLTTKLEGMGVNINDIK